MFDLEPAFIYVEHEVFSNHEKLGVHFLSGNLLTGQGSSNAQEFKTLEGKVDTVHVALCYIVGRWAWIDTIVAVKRLVCLTSKDPESLIVGD